ncbi:MAG: CHAT domain-containing protein [Chloroflexi bacterium]|nr:CHAT domain-containing protein [Chloroflexota bacterium]
MHASKHYGNFDLLLSGGDGGDYSLRVLTTPSAGESAQGVKAPAGSLHQLGPGLAALRRLEMDRAGLRSLGTALTEWLFPEPILRLYRASLVALQPDDGLRVRLRIEPAELHALPWECCYDGELNTFISLDPRTPLVRYLPGSFLRQPLASPALSILVVTASPSGLPPLLGDDEYARVEDAVDRRGGRIALRRTGRGTVNELQDELRLGPRILHFAGHGAFDPAVGGVLFFEEPNRDPQPVEAETLAVILRGSSVRLAVLNACESATADPTDTFAGVAPRLVQAGLPAVVAMQTALPDLAAVAFARAFYGAVADGWGVDAAVAAGRQALFAADPQSPAWATPVLYLNAPDGNLWEWPAAVTGVTAAPPAAAAMPISTFQFNFQGPVTINADVVGGEKRVTVTHPEAGV